MGVVSYPFGSSAVVGSFVASGGDTVRRRGGQRGPVALRPRLSPGVLLSRMLHYAVRYRDRQERARGGGHPAASLRLRAS
jgi:hypothetical protein